MTDHHYSEDQLALDLKWWAAANYLTVAQIYLKDNTLLREPLRAEHIKPRLLGHWGTSPGLSMIYTLLNRHIVATGADWLYVTGPGHGGPALVASTYLEGTYSEIYPEVSDDAEGIHRMCRRFSAPGGVPSHVSVQTPGSIHEGGELGYALAHAAGAAFDHPNLVVACVIGDGEAETGPLSGSWKLPAFLNPRRDGAVLPILHVNGAKIAGPTVYGRSSDEDIQAYLGGQGWAPIVVSGDDPDAVFPQLYQGDLAGAREDPPRCRVPHAAERSGRVRGRQSCCGRRKDGPVHTPSTESWSRAHIVRTRCRCPACEATNHICGNSKSGCGRTVRTSCSTPTDHSSRNWRRCRRRGTSAWGALPTRTVDDFASISRCRRSKSMRFPSNPGFDLHETTRVLGELLRDIYAATETEDSGGIFRLFCPDETSSNRLGAVFETTDRCWQLPITDYDDGLSADGRVMEVLSEHLCEGWLEGYLLSADTGCSRATKHLRW